jgi:hypothetical protein
MRNKKGFADQISKAFYFVLPGHPESLRGNLRPIYCKLTIWLQIIINRNYTAYQ